VADVFAARTRLPEASGGGAAAIDGQLDSCRNRWNQFGLEARIRAQSDGAQTIVHYRLTVSGHADADAVHAAFRGDLEAALSRAAAPPEAWDFEAMARAAEAMARAAAEAADPAPVPFVYDDDTGWVW
jgi:hypothetical protein